MPAFDQSVFHGVAGGAIRSIATAVSGRARSALAEGAREVADDQPLPGPLEAPEQPRQADAGAARGVAFGDGQVRLGSERKSD